MYKFIFSGKKICSLGKTPYLRLVNEIVKVYGLECESQAEEYVKELIDKGFLISTLMPSMSDSNMLSTLIDKIKSLILHENDLSKLKALKRNIEKYEEKPIGEGVTEYLEITDLMESVLSSSNYIQIDLEGTDDISLSNDIQNKIENFASFLIYVSNFKRKTFLDVYKEKYGYNQEVNIYEMLDQVIGIGAPSNYKYPKNEFDDSISSTMYITESEMNYYVHKYTSALENDTDLILDDFEKITGFDFTVANKDMPDSLELYFQINENKNGIDINLSNTLGSTTAGKTFGRFSNISKRFRTYAKTLNEKTQADFTYVCIIK